MTQTDFLPEWLNQGLFEDILMRNIPHYDRIITFGAKQALAGRENYMFQLLSISIKVQLTDRKTTNISYMLKMPPTSEEAKKRITNSGAFRKEITTYQEILPAFEQIFQYVGRSINFAPKSFQIKKNIGIDSIVFDDLKAKGYKNVNRWEGLNMIQTRAVLDKLAAFHAASAVYCESKGRKLPTIYTESLITPQREGDYIEKHVVSNRKFVECLRKHDLREFQDKMKSYQQIFPNQYMKAEKADPSEFNVLTHGDCWSNNIMFKYDAFGNIVDTVFVDFQKCKYGTPVRDLVYFILTSTQLEEKLKNFDYFIKYYHDQLTTNLKLLCYTKKIPKLTELHLSILKYSCFAFLAVSKILPIVLLEPTKLANMDIYNIMDYKTDMREVLTLMFENPRYAEHVQKILPWMENRAFLEE